MSVARLLAWAAASMTAREGLRDPAREARWLLARLLDRPESWLLAHADDDVPDVKEAAFRAWVRRREAGEPAHYLTGSCPFWGREFTVTPDALIPRPESEAIIAEALRLELPPHPRILDVATGSGCLAVTLALELDAGLVVATDVSLGALAVARANVVRHHAAVRLAAADLAYAVGAEFDLVVANLPYVPAGHLPLLVPEVRDHEPAVALVSGRDGTDLLRRFLPDLSRLLVPGGAAILEMGPGQAEALGALVAESRLEEVRRIDDLGGVERQLVVRRSS